MHAYEGLYPSLQTVGGKLSRTLNYGWRKWFAIPEKCHFASRWPS